MNRFYIQTIITSSIGYRNFHLQFSLNKVSLLVLGPTIFKKLIASILKLTETKSFDDFAAICYVGRPQSLVKLSNKVLPRVLLNSFLYLVEAHRTL